MNAKQMLKAAGCSDTVAGRKKFHDMYPTPGHFFAKHGGELSGALHNGQPTAAEFFAWGQPIVGPQGFYGDGGPVEYNRALALVTKAMGGQAGVEMRSTNDYLQNENGYLTDYLNQGQQQFMRNGGDLMQARYGYGDPGGPNAPEQGSSQSTNYSDGYTGNNNQNYNPYLVNQHSFTNGFPPYTGFGQVLGNTIRRFNTPKVKYNMYGNINYGNQQQAGAGQGSSSSSAGSNGGGGSSAPGQSQQNNPMSGYTPYMDVKRTGLFGRPKKYTIGYRKDESSNPAANNGAPGSTTPQGGGSGPAAPSYNQMAYDRDYANAMGNNTGSPSSYKATMGPDMNEQDTQLNLPAFSGKHMGNYMNEQDTPLPQMNVLPAEQKRQKQIEDYKRSQLNVKANRKPQPEEIFSGAPNPGSAYAPTLQRYGGVPQYGTGGAGAGFYMPNPDDTIQYSEGFDWSNLNPWQMEGAAQDFTGFLNNGQNQRIMNEQRERLQNPLSTTADLENRGNQRTLDSNLVSNTRETAQKVTFAGESNVDGQIGMSRYGGTMQGGGAVNIGDEIDIPDDELEQFLANGGQVEYL